MKFINLRFPTVESIGLRSIIKRLNIGMPCVVSIRSLWFCKYNECHTNVEKCVSLYGGERVIGYYILEDDSKTVAFLHSVWLNKGKYIDVTPFRDERSKNVFCVLNEESIKRKCVFIEGGELFYADCL